MKGKMNPAGFGALAALAIWAAPAAAQDAAHVALDVNFADPARYAHVQFHDDARLGTWELQFTAREPRVGQEAVFVRGSGVLRHWKTTEDGSESTTSVVLGFGVSPQLGQREILWRGDGAALIIDPAHGRYFVVLSTPGELAGTTRTQIIDPITSTTVIEATVSGNWTDLFGDKAEVLLPFFIMSSWAGTAGAMDTACNPSYAVCYGDAERACGGADGIASFNYECNPETGHTVCAWTCKGGGGTD